MRTLLKTLTVFMLLVPFLFAQSSTSSGQPAKDNSTQQKPETGKQSDTPKPASDVRFNVDMIDAKIDPCNDFYAYACSKWLAQNPIPADRSSWGRFNELQERGEYIVRDILEKAASAQSGRSANEQKIGDYYASCMDESAIEKAGIKPLNPDFQSIAVINSKGDLPKEIVRLHREGNDVLFNFDSGSDFKNASQIIAEVDQGGM